jgi:hypothetical protein
MEHETVFAGVPPDLAQTLKELSAREPIFHTAKFGCTRAEFEQSTAPDYWEVSASGRRYSRAFILDWLDQTPPMDAAEAGWKSEDLGLRRLGDDTCLLTYTLRQGNRVTRRATIRKATQAGWQILYHQGTIVTAEEDDIAPS